jgi:hypothetical protein
MLEHHWFLLLLRVKLVPNLRCFDRKYYIVLSDRRLVLSMSLTIGRFPFVRCHLAKSAAEKCLLNRQRTRFY